MSSMAGQDQATNDAAPGRTPRPGRWALVFGILGLLAALLVPLAPVTTENTTVTWPQEGAEPRSTTAFFLPYAPEELRLRVPDSAVAAASRSDGSTTVLSSTLSGNDNRGFAVLTEDRQLRVLVGGQEVYRGVSPRSGASVDLDVRPEGGRVCVGGDCHTFSGDRVRVVYAFNTDLDPQQARGMHLRAQTSNWFENSPTVAKLALIAAQVLLAGISFGLLVRGDRLRRASAEPRQRAPRLGPARGMLDVAVAAILGCWAILGPRTPDDGFTEGIVRNALDTGAFTNYYRWENAAESPFTLALHLLQPLVALQANPLLQRMPSVLLGVASWLLLSRGVLPVILPEHHRRWWVRGLAAVSLLLWWMPFDLAVRPEPFVAFGVTVVLTCLVRATARTDGVGLALLGCGAVAAGLTLAVNPVGVVTAAPVLLFAPRIWRLLRRPGTSRWHAVGWLAALGCLGALGVVAMFADQSLYGVLRATELHQFYGPSRGWFEEVRRYENLLGYNTQGGLGRRLPVLITFALVACVALALARGASSLPGLRACQRPVLVFVLGLGLLWLTPSKWTHYFGALAGPGALVLTTSVIVLCVAARHWVRHHAALVIGVFGTVVTVLAVSLSYAGENTWFLFSHYGLPYDDGPFRPLNSPLLWFALAGILLLATLLPRWRDADRPDLSARGMLARMPAVIGAVSAVSGVVVLLVSFALAPVRQAGSYSVGEQNLRHLAARGCGIADHVVTTRDAPNGVLGQVDGGDQLDGFTALGGYPNSSKPPADPGTGRAQHLWGSKVRGDGSTGRMTSGWFTLPELRANQELALEVAGRTGDGNRLVLEFARSGPNGPSSLGRRVLDDAYKDSDERRQYPTARVVEDTPQDNTSWRTLYVGSSAVPDGTDRVRVRAVDATTDPGGWLAVTGPRIRDVAPLRPMLESMRSVYVDWSMIWNVPCVRDSPTVGDGLVQAPNALVIPPASLGFDGRVSFVRAAGGTFAGVNEIGNRATVPTRLQGTEDKPQYEDWGQFVVVSYPVRRDAYDRHTTPVDRWGWEGPRSPLGYPPAPQ